MNLLAIIFPSRKIFFWVGFFVLGMLFFSLYRALFLLTYFPGADGASFLTIARSFLIGLRFDSYLISFAIIPFFILLLLPMLRLESNLVRAILRYFLTAIFAVFFLFSVADLRYFEVFGSRLNYFAVDYFDYPGEFFYSAITDMAFWKLATIWVLTVAVFYYCLKRLLEFSLRLEPPALLLPRLIGNLILAALLALGARGSLGIKPLDWGAALFSENHTINQMALNSPYTLAHSLYEESQEGRKIFGGDTDRFAYYPLDSAYQTVAAMLGIENTGTDSGLTLRRHLKQYEKREFKPNIIILIMESWSADKVGALGSRWKVTPRFDSLAQQGILFSRFYANGIRTNRGVPAILCSFPSPSGRSIMKRYAADYPFSSLAEILKPLGYSSIFAYGGDVEFDNMEGFLRTAGYDRFYREDDFDVSKKLGKWGIPDHVIFEKLAEEIKEFPRPFHLAVLTLSNHDPHLVPDDRFKLYGDTLPLARVLNTFYYSDWAIGHLVDLIKAQPVFDSTIFVFTSDHCAYQSGKHPLAPTNFHIPLLIYAPALIDSGGIVITRVGSQVDIVPTVAALVPTDASFISWGRDLLHGATDDSGFAVIVSEEKLGLIEGTKFFFAYANNPHRFLYDLNDPLYYQHNIQESLPEQTSAMERRLKSYIQLANHLARGGTKKRHSAADSTTLSNRNPDK
ncbi:MAG: sulfatase-like hydrolase/transferase [bacterium]|jgi:phosphoglycerol transferase MdoB-like AlkP superfamily enzyme